MLTIITGPLNSGKSTTLLSLLHAEQSPGGLIQRKLTRESDGFVTGYDLVRLRDRLAIPFARWTEDLPHDWDGGPSLGRYSFSLSAITKAIACIQDDIREGRHPIVVDEIGRLELQAEGFFPVIEMLAQSDAILVIRDIFLDPLLRLMHKSTEDCKILACTQLERRDSKQSVQVVPLHVCS